MNRTPLLLTDTIPPLDLATLDVASQAAAAAFVARGTAANTVRSYRSGPRLLGRLAAGALRRPAR